MKPTKAIQFFRDIVFSAYRWLQKVVINAQQNIAHWRARISRGRQQGVVLPRPLDILIDKHRQQQATTTSDQANKDKSKGETAARIIYSHQVDGLPAKTSHPKRFKIYSLFRRLSIRNLMDYCVIALNEASGSGCSNRFDLQACERPVWLLGKQYELPQDIDKLVDDIRSKLWITYRRNFPPIDENARYTTDRGFGCMIRCGQMVLANALLCKNLGRDWRWSSQGLDTNPNVYARILKLFQDKEECPYSIHNIIRTGQQEGRVVGEWFGPNTIAQALKRITSSLHIAELSNNDILISIDAALDNVVVVDEVKARFRHANTSISSTSIGSHNGQSTEVTTKLETSNWVPGILFIQLRLGLSKINPLYLAALRKTFQFKNSLGIIGGRPNHALYLIGYTDDDIIYLDPHSTQQYIDFDSNEPAATVSIGDQDLNNKIPVATDSTYHCACPEKMSLDRLDPSLALCFYFHNEQDFDEWCKLSNELLIKSEQAPMFEIAQSRPSDWNISLTSTAVRSSVASDPQNQDSTVVPNQAKKMSLQTQHDMEKFTTLSDSDEGLDDLETNVVERDQSQATNDDEEFEMLG